MENKLLLTVLEILIPIILAAIVKIAPQQKLSDKIMPLADIAGNFLYFIWFKPLQSVMKISNIEAFIESLIVSTLFVIYTFIKRIHDKILDNILKYEGKNEANK